MSIKSKNLEYDSNEPTFLRRMRGEIGGRVEPEGEHSAARLSRRGKTEKIDDDAPAYVMDGSNDTLTKEEYEALVSEKDASSTDHNSLAIHKGSQGATGAGEQIQGPLSEDAELYVAEAGRHSKKRKIGKVIKDADEIDPTSEVTKTVAPTTKKITSKTKKAKKAIKLSFDVD